MKTRTSHALVTSLVLAGGLVGLALAPVPPKWRILDDSRIAFWKPPLGHISLVKVDNTGRDEVTVYAKPFQGPRSCSARWSRARAPCTPCPRGR